MRRTQLPCINGSRAGLAGLCLPVTLLLSHDARAQDVVSIRKVPIPIHPILAKALVLQGQQVSIQPAGHIIVPSHRGLS